MTNRAMVKDRTDVPAASGQEPNTTPLPPMPAPEDSATPATEREPIDSPQPNSSVERAPPDTARSGLATRR